MRRRKTPAEKQGLQDIRPTIWIGRSGITPGIVVEIENQMKTRKIIKIKWLESAEVDPYMVAQETGTVLLQIRGHTFILGDRSVYSGN
ncbi:MAG: YhbY family RNA-binding protein [Methanospirillaceae archaeon]|nr:YhbY family RNA-binding protein [Methanospirillaceae archaeon]